LVEAGVSFAPTVASDWRFHFRAGPSNLVVVRGARLFSGEAEIFPPFVPVLE